ncbi:hypothetical protein PC9H_007007 [Pleurotus ostreatus]|uniref:Uncharacterized protein n=1 Tax=Pleurotus ostreatus TaxID=5322 RepID=A0A8H6ZQB0_PLEOS|nr:uncharacterized protein PC9H_007007 [Pleurotus ostreatus]KAF7427792.1 hypothetical protein PC9H_007007 [Pleurotus ostreatus]KAJ8695763.1 hypothetical protein PTI98_005691 [Pleurotus ostreatus]
MPRLPYDLLSYIVEAVDDPKTQWVLLTVSRETGRFPLTAIYRELSFDSRDAPSSYVTRDPKYLISLEKLTIGAETNPHLRFTASFNLFSYTSNDLGNKCLRALLPFLTNLRRLAINSIYVDPDTLGLLPPTARLTHLILGSTNYSSSFVDLLASHPNLRLFSVYQFGAPLGSEERPYNAAISPTALPEIHSLKCPIRIAKRFGHRPSVHDVCFTTAWSQRHTPFPEETEDAIVKAFPSVRAAYFPEPFNFPGVASLSRRLASLEYLRLDVDGVTAPLPWNLLSTTKLKYLRLVGDMIPMGAPERTARSVFDAIGAMVMVDISEDEKDKFRRFYRHSRTGFSVQICTSQWQPWWESVQPDIDNACLLDRDRLVG